MTLRRRRGDEAELGAYVVLYALLGVAFFTVAAIVLDIAALRQGRRSDRAAADLAATAGVADLATDDPSSFARACEDAWGYVVANRTETAGGTTSPPDCGAAFPSTDACTGLTPARTANASIGPLTISITHPVPDSSPLMLAEAQGADVAQSIEPTTDGSPCERLAVRIVRERTFLFARIAGAIGGRTDVHSVARALTATSTTEVPAIVALEPSGCNALTTDAGGSLRFGSPAQAGLAIVDSDGAGCAGGSYVVSAGASGDAAGRLVGVDSAGATAQIRSFALAGTSFAAAYDPGAVGDGRLDPQPEPSVGRTGRALIDRRYRCATCLGGSDVITPLRAERGAGVPPGATTYAGPCTIPAGPPQEFSASHVYVDCPDLRVEGRMTFHGASVTVAGNVTLADNACVAVNDVQCGGTSATSQDAVVYLRGGLVKGTRGRLVLPRTFLYADGALTLGVDEDTAVANSTLRWTSPRGGGFEDLLFWGEATDQMTLGEQRNTILEGTFFAPNAPVVMNPRSTGQGVTVPMQVVARTVRLTGAGTYRLEPTADRATGSFTRQVRLIR